MAIFFTSDTHFWHRGALKFRSFDTVEAMNAAMIDAWNCKVGPDDDVFHLGDLSFAGVERTLAILERLNGRKHWIMGNHDRDLAKKEVKWHFREIEHYAELKITDPDAVQGVQKIVMCHFPILSWNWMHHGSWMLHGHSHGALKHPYDGMRMMDVGVDPNGLAPVSYSEVKAYMSGRRGHVCDQHKGSE
ncbi:metallophosphoesterase [Cupriavidus metallidurans]|uniref:metallophosphoesterase n=1 Tax=Cupriavidus metallidurans TaxID=119219 RepID=UPI001CCE78CA|nr:metallophosphoesterase [Cupriavidus metallidurans]UBM12691.1 metallophosphoesterase [Cupriavidus metallidurans]